MEYGLIGGKLGHSYSRLIHEQVGGYAYELRPLPTEEAARAFFQARARIKNWRWPAAMLWTRPPQPSAQ